MLQNPCCTKASLNQPGILDGFPDVSLQRRRSTASPAMAEFWSSGCQLSSSFRRSLVQFSAGTDELQCPAGPSGNPDLNHCAQWPASKFEAHSLAPDRFIKTRRDRLEGD